MSDPGPFGMGVCEALPGETDREHLDGNGESKGDFAGYERFDASGGSLGRSGIPGQLGSG